MRCFRTPPLPTALPCADRNLEKRFSRSGCPGALPAGAAAFASFHERNRTMHRKILIVVAALAVSACASSESPTDPSNPSVVLYTAIGASDTTGFGSSVPCMPLTSCPLGTGYVQLIERRLESSGKTVTLLNIGIPGAVLGPEVEALGDSLGREHRRQFSSSGNCRSCSAMRRSSRCSPAATTPTPSARRSRTAEVASIRQATRRRRSPTSGAIFGR